MNFGRGNTCAPSNFRNFHTFAFDRQHSQFTLKPPPGRLRHGSDWDPDAQKRQRYNLFYSPILIPRLESSNPNGYNRFEFSHVDLPPLFIGMDQFTDFQTNCQNILFLDNSFETVSESEDTQSNVSPPINRFQLVSIGPITQEVANNFIAFASLQLTPTIQYPSQSLHSTTHPQDNHDDWIKLQRLCQLVDNVNSAAIQDIDHFVTFIHQFDTIYNNDVLSQGKAPDLLDLPRNLVHDHNLVHEPPLTLKKFNSLFFSYNNFLYHSSLQNSPQRESQSPIPLGAEISLSPPLHDPNNQPLLQTPVIRGIDESGLNLINIQQQGVLQTQLDFCYHSLESSPQVSPLVHINTSDAIRLNFHTQFHQDPSIGLTDVDKMTANAANPALSHPQTSSHDVTMLALFPLDEKPHEYNEKTENPPAHKPQSAQSYTKLTPHTSSQSQFNNVLPHQPHRQTVNQTSHLNKVPNSTFNYLSNSIPSTSTQRLNQTVLPSVFINGLSHVDQKMECDSHLNKNSSNQFDCSPNTALARDMHHLNHSLHTTNGPIFVIPTTSNQSSVMQIQMDIGCNPTPLHFPLRPLPAPPTLLQSDYKDSVSQVRGSPTLPQQLGTITIHSSTTSVPTTVSTGIVDTGLPVDSPPQIDGTTQLNPTALFPSIATNPSCSQDLLPNNTGVESRKMNTLDENGMHQSASHFLHRTSNTMVNNMITVTQTIPGQHQAIVIHPHLNLAQVSSTPMISTFDLQNPSKNYNPTLSNPPLDHLLALTPLAPTQPSTRLHSNQPSSWTDTTLQKRNDDDFSIHPISLVNPDTESQLKGQKSNYKIKGNDNIHANITKLAHSSSYTNETINHRDTLNKHSPKRNDCQVGDSSLMNSNLTHHHHHNHHQHHQPFLLHSAPLSQQASIQGIRPADGHQNVENHVDTNFHSHTLILPTSVFATTPFITTNTNITNISTDALKVVNPTGNAGTTVCSREPSHICHKLDTTSLTSSFNTTKTPNYKLGVVSTDSMDESHQVVSGSGKHPRFVVPSQKSQRLLGSSETTVSNNINPTQFPSHFPNQFTAHKPSDVKQSISRPIHRLDDISMSSASFDNKTLQSETVSTHFTSKSTFTPSHHTTTSRTKPFQVDSVDIMPNTSSLGQLSQAAPPSVYFPSTAKLPTKNIFPRVRDKPNHPNHHGHSNSSFSLSAFSTSFVPNKSASHLNDRQLGFDTNNATLDIGNSTPVLHPNSQSTDCTTSNLTDIPPYDHNTSLLENANKPVLPATIQNQVNSVVNHDIRNSGELDRQYSSNTISFYNTNNNNNNHQNGNHQISNSVSTSSVGNVSLFPHLLSIPQSPTSTPLVSPASFAFPIKQIDKHHQQQQPQSTSASPLAATTTLPHRTFSNTYHKLSPSESKEQVAELTTFPHVSNMNHISCRVTSSNVHDRIISHITTFDNLLGSDSTTTTPLNVARLESRDFADTNHSSSLILSDSTPRSNRSSRHHDNAQHNQHLPQRNSSLNSDSPIVSSHFPSLSSVPANTLHTNSLNAPSNVRSSQGASFRTSLRNHQPQKPHGTSSNTISNRNANYIPTPSITASQHIQFNHSTSSTHNPTRLKNDHISSSLQSPYQNSLQPFNTAVNLHMDEADHRNQTTHEQNQSITPRTTKHLLSDTADTVSRCPRAQKRSATTHAADSTYTSLRSLINSGHLSNAMQHDASSHSVDHPYNQLQVSNQFPNDINNNHHIQVDPIITLSTTPSISRCSAQSERFLHSLHPITPTTIINQPSIHNSTTRAQTPSIYAPLSTTSLPRSSITNTQSNHQASTLNNSSETCQPQIRHNNLVTNTIPVVNSGFDSTSVDSTMSTPQGTVSSLYGNIPPTQQVLQTNATSIGPTVGVLPFSISDTTDYLKHFTKINLDDNTIKPPSLAELRHEPPHADININENHSTYPCHYAASQSIRLESVLDSTTLSIHSRYSTRSAHPDLNLKPLTTACTQQQYQNDDSMRHHNKQKNHFWTADEDSNFNGTITMDNGADSDFETEGSDLVDFSLRHSFSTSQHTLNDLNTNNRACRRLHHNQRNLNNNNNNNINEPIRPSGRNTSQKGGKKRFFPDPPDPSPSDLSSSIPVNAKLFPSSSNTNTNTNLGTTADCDANSTSSLDTVQPTTFAEFFNLRRG